MATRLEQSTRRYIGTSGDAKPFVGQVVSSYAAGALTTVTLSATDVPAGSSFLETDTGLIYRYDGTLWSVAAPVDEATQLLRAVLREQRLTRAVLEHVHDVEAEDLIDE